MRRNPMKWATLMAILTIGTSTFYPITAQATSKTPNLNTGFIFEPIEPIEMPGDYPQDLVDFYADNVDARSYVVIDRETNKILAGHDSNVPYPIASMTKVLSAYLILEAIEAGELKLDDKLTIPTEIVEGISSNPTLSNAWLVEDVEYSVEDLLYAVMLPSANDATSALMWQIYGDEQTAVAAMNEQLHEWGITNANIYTVSGAPNIDIPSDLWLPGSNEMNQNMMSASDMALVAQHVTDEHPELYDITQTPEYLFMEGTPEEQLFVNPNQLLENGQYARENVTGLKSGYTDEAGMCFVATGTQDGREYIAVAMGTFGEGMSSYWEIEILLDGLLEYPHLYEKDLPTNLPTPVELTDESEVAEDTDDDVEDVSTDILEDIPVENNRDNPLTNFMRDVFNFFE